jgi:hypothetical protein
MSQEMLVEQLEAEPKLRAEPPVTVSTDFSCAVTGPPLRPASEPLRAP